jgi:hypothetical protein
VNTPHLKRSIRQKIDSLTAYVEDKLGNSDEKEFTRVLALVMQNDIGDIRHIGLTNNTDRKVTIEDSTAAFSFFHFAGRFIKNYSFAKEFKHLLIRFPQLSFK